jgi:hypothetical protein
MRDMRLRVLYSIGYISPWYEAHHREIPVDAKTAGGRENLCRHNRLEEATFICVHCNKKGVELQRGSLTRYYTTTRTEESWDDIGSLIGSLNETHIAILPYVLTYE